MHFRLLFFDQTIILTVTHVFTLDRRYCLLLLSDGKGGFLRMLVPSWVVIVIVQTM